MPPHELAIIAEMEAIGATPEGKAALDEAWLAVLPYILGTEKPKPVWFGYFPPCQRDERARIRRDKTDESRGPPRSDKRRRPHPGFADQGGDKAVSTNSGNELPEFNSAPQKFQRDFSANGDLRPRGRR